MFKNLKLKYPFLSIIAVIIVVCLIAIACKKKATEPSFTVEVEKVQEQMEKRQNLLTLSLRAIRCLLRMAKC